MVIWTHVVAGHGFLLNLVEVAAIVAVIAAVWLVVVGSWGWAFVATTVTIAGMVLNISAVSTQRDRLHLDPANNLTIHNASSAPYSLKVMTVIVAIFLPAVLVYQGWTYHVFRRRLTAPS